MQPPAARSAISYEPGPNGVSSPASPPIFELSSLMRSTYWRVWRRRRFRGEVLVIDAADQGPQPLRRKDRDHGQDQAQKQGAIVADRDKVLVEADHDARAQDWPAEGAPAADDDHRQEVDDAREVEHGRRDAAVVVRHVSAGQSREERADRE